MHDDDRFNKVMLSPSPLKPMISVEEATQQILQRADALPTSMFPIENAIGKFLAEPFKATIDHPTFTNSAMDGIAVRFQDLGKPLLLQGTIACGSAKPSPLKGDHAYKIMTGAPLPLNADTVVAKEDITIDNNQVTVQAKVSSGQHIRAKGSNFRKNDLLFDKGSSIGLGLQSLCASMGQTNINAHRTPTVAVLSTGDELVHYSKVPTWGQLRNTNNLMICSMLTTLGIDAKNMGMVKDNLDATVSAINECLTFDIIITTGGVSVGDFDFVKQALDHNEIQLHFWKVAMKPGKPVVYGSHQNGTHFFGLPGNPGSAFVAFSLFLRPFIKKLMGSASPKDPVLWGTLSEPYSKKPGRAHYLRAKLSSDGNNTVFDASIPQGSGSLLSLCNVDVLVETPANAHHIDTKTPLKAILLR